MTWRTRATALGLDGLPVYELRERLSSLTGKAATSNDADYLAREIVKRTPEAAVDAPAPYVAVAEAVPEPPASAAATTGGAGGDGVTVPVAGEGPTLARALAGGVTLTEGGTIGKSDPATVDPDEWAGEVAGDGALVGIHEGIDAETYHADPAAGSTEIRLWRHSKAAADRQRREDAEPSEGMDVGSAVHTAAELGLRAYVAGDDAMAAIRCVTPDPHHLVTYDHIRTACKGRDGFKGNWPLEQMIAWVREHAPDLRLWADEIPRLRAEGLTPLTPQGYDRAMGAIEAVRENPLAVDIIAQSRREVSYFHQTADGVRLKGRIDLAFYHLTLDLKSSARPEAYSGHGIERVIRSAMWPTQSAMYEALRLWLGEEAYGGGCVLVTSEPPHVCEVIEYAEVEGVDLMQEGRETFAACLENYTRHALNPRAWKGWSSKGETPELVRLTSRGRIAA